MDYDAEFDDTEFDPALEAEFESELHADDSFEDFVDDEFEFGEHLSIEQLAERELAVEDIYAQYGAAWDDV